MKKIKNKKRNEKMKQNEEWTACVWERCWKMCRKLSSLEQYHKHKDSMVRVIKSPYRYIPQLLHEDRSEVHPLVRNLLHVKARQAPLPGRLKFYSEN